MKKLELKHYAVYVPYNITAICSISGTKTTLINGIKYNDNAIFFEGKTENGYPINSNTYKPILRPLSDLTKEIEHNGEKFVPMEWLKENYFVSEIQLFELGLGIYTEKVGYTLKPTYFAVYEKLLEWHFDIYNLIENNLAIDINEINK